MIQPDPICISSGCKVSMMTLVPMNDLPSIFIPAHLNILLRKFPVKIGDTDNVNNNFLYTLKKEYIGTAICFLLSITKTKVLFINPAAVF